MAIVRLVCWFRSETPYTNVVGSKLELKTRAITIMEGFEHSTLNRGSRFNVNIESGKVCTTCHAVTDGCTHTTHSPDCTGDTHCDNVTGTDLDTATVCEAQGRCKYTSGKDNRQSLMFSFVINIID